MRYAAFVPAPALVASSRCAATALPRMSAANRAPDPTGSSVPRAARIPFVDASAGGSGAGAASGGDLVDYGSRADVIAEVVREREAREQRVREHAAAQKAKEAELIAAQKARDVVVNEVEQTAETDVVSGDATTGAGQAAKAAPAYMAGGSFSWMQAKYASHVAVAHFDSDGEEETTGKHALSKQTLSENAPSKQALSKAKASGAAKKSAPKKTKPGAGKTIADGARKAAEMLTTGAKKSKTVEKAPVAKKVDAKAVSKDPISNVAASKPSVKAKKSKAPKEAAREAKAESSSSKPPPSTSATVAPKGAVPPVSTSAKLTASPAKPVPVTKDTAGKTDPASAVKVAPDGRMKSVPSQKSAGTTKSAVAGAGPKAAVGEQKTLESEAKATEQPESSSAAPSSAVSDGPVSKTKPKAVDTDSDNQASGGFEKKTSSKSKGKGAKKKGKRKR